jgi:ubiquitin C-terminal hydrolase
MFTLPLVTTRKAGATVDSCLASHCGATPFVAGPQVLVLQLMRFTNQNQRINTPVSFSDRLGLPLIDGTTCLYSLRALVGHSGTTAGGHHIAHVKVGNQDPPVWHRCNDAIIQAETPQYHANPDVHLLFYDRPQRRE